MSKNNLIQARTCVYNVNYHVVWSVKYVRPTQQLWKGHLWNSSFYIETVGSISEDAIRKYIEHQKTRG